MCGKGSNTTTSTTGPNPQAMAAYNDVLGKAASAGSTPYAPYTGEEVAPINQQQMAGIGGINAAAGQAQSGIQAGFGQIQGSSQPITASQIQGYESPYTNDVVNATEADFAHQNAVGQAGVVGNAAAQNALGGDRVGVAQALTAEGQSRSQAPVIAGLRNTGFQTALGAAENQQRTGLAGGQAMVGAAGAGQAAAMQGANAQIGAGTLEQGTQQAQDTQARQDYFQKMGYPFQIAQYLASIDTAVGSQMGGQSTTEGPQPNQFAQIAGGALTAAAMFAKRGGRVAGFADGGAALPDMVARGRGIMDQDRDNSSRFAARIDAGGEPASMSRRDVIDFLRTPISGFAPERRHRASGGYSGPWGGSDSWVPSMQPVHGKGPPAAPAAPKQQGLSADQMKGVGVLGKDVSNWWSNQDADPGSASNPLPGLSPDDYAARGGRIRRYATGGFAYGGPPEWLDDAVADNHDYTPTVAGLGATEPAVSFNSRFDAAPAERPDDAKGRNYLKNYFSTGPTPDSQAALDRGFQQPDEAEVIPFPKARPPNADKPIPPNTGEVDTADAGVGAIDRAAHIPAPANDDESLGYQPKERTPGFAPTSLAPQEDKSWLERLGVRVTPELKQGLLQAGLAMMATHRGGPGSFLGAAGEAGMAGVGAFEKTRQQQVENDREQAKFEEHKKEADRPYHELTALEKYNAAHRGEMTEFQEETLKRQAIDQAIKMKSPIKMGETISGRPIMALPKLDGKGNLDLYPIAPDGTVSATPVRPGESIKPASPQSVAPAASATPQATDETAPNAADNAPPASPQARNESYLAEVQKEDPGYAAALKKAADYELDPNRYASMRQGNRQKFINDVLQYDPSYDSRTYPLRYQAMRAFQPGQKMGDSVRAFNTAIAHLDTLQGLYTALQNHDSQAYNRIANTFKTQFGYDAPNNVAAAAQLVGGEIVKAVVGSQNALGDREEVRQSISRDLANGQAIGVIKTYTNLMAGQLRSIRKAYEEGTGLHNFDKKYLIPRTVQAVNSAEGPAVPLAGEKRSGWTFKGGDPKDKKNWVKE